MGHNYHSLSFDFQKFKVALNPMYRIVLNFGKSCILQIEIEIERAHRTPTKVPGNNNKKPRPVHVAFLRYTDKVKILSSAAARLKDNPYQGNLIGVGADFARETQERRKALIPFKKHLQNKLGRERKVFIAYPAILKYLDENGKPKIVQDEDFKKLKGEMQEEEGR